MMDKLLKTINDCNSVVIGQFSEMEIKYDGLTCPKCLSRTVHAFGNTWCPSFSCDYGHEVKITILTKFTP